MELVSLYEYEKRTGIKRQKTHYNVKIGRLKTYKGKINVDEANELFGLIDKIESNQESFHSNKSNKNEEEFNYYKERAIHEKLKIQLTQLELGRKSGQLVEIELVDQELSKLVTAVRQRLLALPTKLTPQLVNQKSPGFIKELITEAIYEALSEFQHYNPESGKILSEKLTCSQGESDNY